MRKNISFFILIGAILSIIVFELSCSGKEDNNVDIIIGPDIDNNNKPNITGIVASTEKDGVVMTYCLLNTKGDTTLTFSEGEEIIFDLQIENTTEQPIYFPDGPSFLGYDTFRIYNDDGIDFGVSWTYPPVWTYDMKYLWPSTPKHYQCPWYSDDVIKATFPFIFSPSTIRLICGSYFTGAYCHLKNGTILSCNLSFNIQ